MQKTLATLLGILLAANVFGQETVPGVSFWTPWEETTIAIGNERSGFNDHIAGRVTYANPEACDGNATLPYIAKAPDEERYLLMTTMSFPQAKGTLMVSTDECESWTPWDGPSPSGWGLTCAGNGVILASDGHYRSTDGGKSWNTYGFAPNPRFGEIVDCGWDPMLVDPKSGGKHLYCVTYFSRNFEYMEHKTIPLLRESFDAGATWTPYRGIAEFVGANEVLLSYNAKGEIVAAMRNTTLMAPSDDHFDRLSTAYSTDGGVTWSQPKVVAGNGRMHPSMALLPDGRMVLTYVVRQGYAKTDGKFTYGIEGVVSHDGGHTWDTDHRYVLARWSSDCMVTDENGRSYQVEHFWAAPQCTSTHYLPRSKCLVTAYGTNQNAKKAVGGVILPRQIALVKWMPLESYAAPSETSVPQPVSAEESLRQLRNNRYWPVNYQAQVGLPDCGWRNSYPEKALALKDGWLQFDHRGTEGCLSLRGIDHLEQINGPIALRMRINILTEPSKRPDRFKFYATAGNGQNKYDLYIRFDGEANIHDGIFGRTELPTTPGTPFLLEVYCDPVARCFRLWIDGRLVKEVREAPRYLAPETPSELVIGSYSPHIGGMAEVSAVQFGQIE